MNTANRRTPLCQALLACYPALAATFVLSLFINASMLASPLYSMQVYDRVLTSRNTGTLLMLTLIVARVPGALWRAGIRPLRCARPRRRSVRGNRCAGRCSKP